MLSPSGKCLLVALALATVVSARVTHAGEWPERPVKIIVPYGVGGITDALSRLAADRLATAYKQAFVIENRPGAMGTIGTQQAVRSAPDGYTLYFAAGAQVLAVPLLQKLSYDPVRDLIPISISGFNAFALGINSQLPATDFRSFVDYAKQHPGKVNYGIAQVGTVSHLLPAMLARRFGIEIVGVPFASGPTAVIGLMQNSVQLVATNATDLLNLKSDPSVRVIAVSSPGRLPSHPDVPTIGESVDNFSFTAWNGMFAPAETPEDVLQKIESVLSTANSEKSYRDALAKLGVIPALGTRKEVQQALLSEAPVYAAALEAAGLKK